MDCQRKIANKKADYLLAVKGNRERLEKAISQTFNSSMINDYDGDKYSIKELGHGRTETRLAIVSHDIDMLGGLA